MNPVIDPDLAATLRRLKLGQVLHTLGVPPLTGHAGYAAWSAWV